MYSKKPRALNPAAIIGASLREPHPRALQWLQFKGHIRIVEKVHEKQAWILVYINYCVCVLYITVLHECWMQDTPTSHCVTW